MLIAQPSLEVEHALPLLGNARWRRRASIMVSETRSSGARRDWAAPAALHSATGSGSAHLGLRLRPVLVIAGSLADWTARGPTPANGRHSRTPIAMETASPTAKS